jgi:hypothetical protein
MSEAEKPEQQEPPFMDAELAVDAMQVSHGVMCRSRPDASTRRDVGSHRSTCS